MRAGDAFLGYAVRKEITRLNKLRGEAAIDLLLQKISIKVIHKQKRHILCYALKLPMSIATEETILNMLREVAARLNLLLTQEPC